MRKTEKMVNVFTMKGIQDLLRKMKNRKPTESDGIKNNLVINLCQFIGGQNLFPF
jgi:hypothetical protein